MPLGEEKKNPVASAAPGDPAVAQLPGQENSKIPPAGFGVDRQYPVEIGRRMERMPE